MQSIYGRVNHGLLLRTSMNRISPDILKPILLTLDEGGNFIDSANNYQFQETEKWVGEWMSKRGNRDEIGLSLPSVTSLTRY
jgi:predicted aldo/keto reductase-like oxidoreductase